MTRAKHSHRAVSRMKSRILRDRAEIMRQKVHDARLLSERLARKEQDRRFRDKQRDAYHAIIRDFEARDPHDSSERWEIHDPRIIEYRRASGFRPMGWHIDIKTEIHYPKEMSYADVYPRIPESEKYLQKYFKDSP